MNAATMPAPAGIATRVLAFAGTLTDRKRDIVTKLVERGQARLAMAGTANRLSAADTAAVLDDKTRSAAQNDTDWTYDIWKYSFD